jgi:uncharacterized protein (TIGR02246 family)
LRQIAGQHSETVQDRVKIGHHEKGRYVMRSRWIISAIAAICLAVSASAQQADQSTRLQIARLVATYAENFNKQDAAGIAGLYTKDGVLVSSAAKAVKTGPQEIEQSYQGGFKSGLNHIELTVDQVLPFGTDAAISMGEFHLAGQGQSGPMKVDGHWTGVDVREGSTWKIRLATSVPNPPPVASVGAVTSSGPTR